MIDIVRLLETSTVLTFQPTPPYCMPACVTPLETPHSRNGSLVTSPSPRGPCGALSNPKRSGRVSRAHPPAPPRPSLSSRPSGPREGQRIREECPTARTHLPNEQRVPIHPAHQRSCRHDRASRRAAARSQGKHKQQATQGPPPPPILVPAHEITRDVEHRSGHKNQLAFSGSAALLLCTLPSSAPTRSS